MAIKYLTNENDQKGFVKMLVRQAMADGDVAVREISCIKMLINSAGVSTDIAMAAIEELTSGQSALPDMSKSAVVYATMSLFDVSMADFEFKLSEARSLKKMFMDFGFVGNKELDKMLNEYCADYIDIFVAMEKIISSIKGADAMPEDAKSYLTTLDDKKSFVKVMTMVGRMDDKVLPSEEFFINNISKAAEIEQSEIDEAVAEYNSGNTSIAFSSESAKAAAIRCAIRVACIDNDFDMAEQDGIIKMAKDLGVEIDKALLEKIAELATRKQTLIEKKKEITEYWIGI